MKRDNLRNHLLSVGGALFLSGILASPTIFAKPFDYHVSGYLREYIGIKLDNSPDFGSGTTGKKVSGAGKVAMARSVLRLDLDAAYRGVRFKAIGRAVHERKTSYLKGLQKSVTATGGNPDFVDEEYEDSGGNGEIRELYAIFPVAPNVSLTLGKQQVAWGEGDFFRISDIIHGNDLRWRPTERENEETRNPLWLVNAVVDFPDIESQLQLIYRPGWDKAQDVVNLRDIFGGRGQQQPFKGFDFTAGIPQGYDHSSGDTDDANYGLRWMSRIPNTNIDYSLLYYRGLWRDGVVNSGANPTGSAPPSFLAGFLGEMIHPFVDTWGITYNIDVPSKNLVFRGEATYIPNRPFNVGSLGGTYTPFGAPGFYVPVPGLGGITEKQVLSTLWALDWNVNWTMKWLGTQRQSLWTVEVFDDWIINHHGGDDLVAIVGNGATAQEHHTIFTTTLAMNYKFDNVQPTVALLYDVNYGDAVFVPSLNLRYGDHWRLYLEGNFVLAKHTVGAVATGAGECLENDTHVLGLDGHNDQFLVRLTYQF